MLRCRFFLVMLLFPLLAGLTGASDALARDAAFADPGSSSSMVAGSDAVVVEPKGDIDTGESVVNVAKRSTLFFVNKTNTAIEVAGVTTNDDGNVKSSVISDDCSREHKIGPGSRCSIVIETTPSNTGAWTAEVLLTHKGAGRIARAKLTGKAGGQYSADKKDSGFALSTKDVKPIEFGDVEANGTKAVRTALMVNDSPETISLLSIDVIAAENGLERLDQGCVIDMELKPGESCPVTLVWKPVNKGLISTDLIIRHTGRLGFAVIPVRGASKEGKESSISEAKAAKTSGKDDNAASKSGGKAPTTAEVLEKSAADKIPPLTSDLLSSGGSEKSAAAPVAKSGTFHLIGTVGNRAVLLKPDGATAIVAISEDIPYGENKIAKVTNVMPKGVEIFMEGKKKQLILEAAAELTGRASAAASKDSGKSDPTKPSSAQSLGSMGK